MSKKAHEEMIERIAAPEQKTRRIHNAQRQAEFVTIANSRNVQRRAEYAKAHETKPVSRKDGSSIKSAEEILRERIDARLSKRGTHR